MGVSEIVFVILDLQALLFCIFPFQVFFPRRVVNDIESYVSFTRSVEIKYTSMIQKVKFSRCSFLHVFIISNMYAAIRQGAVTGGIVFTFKSKT